MSLNVAIVGAGPAGLYLGYLLRKRDPSISVRIFEQNAKESTYGFGVGLSDRALSMIEDADAASKQRLTDAMYWFDGQTIDVRGGKVTLRAPVPVGAIERLVLLRILQDLAEQEGVDVTYGRRVGADIGEADLVVGADGANSVVRSADEAGFGVRVSHLKNRMAWYGTSRVFQDAGLSFLDGPGGAYVGHFYPYKPTMSTFVAECDDATWNHAGFDALTDEDRRHAMEEVFAAELDGHPLIDNRSIWRRFAVVDVERWSVGKTVLIGDALRPAHPSIGSGTRLAMSDAIALAQSIGEHPSSMPDALAAFEAVHRPRRQKLTDAAIKSYDWYETYQAKMTLHPLDFAYSFMTRTGRFDDARLQGTFPDFAALYAAHREAA